MTDALKHRAATGATDETLVRRIATSDGEQDTFAAPLFEQQQQGARLIFNAHVTVGAGAAPSPLMYFAAGLGLSVLAEVEALAKRLGIPLRSVRLEQKTAFSSAADRDALHPSDIFAEGECSELHVIVESDAPQTQLRDVVRWCR